MIGFNFKTILMHQDEYERHKFCVDHLMPLSLENILDVGGTGLLQRFFTNVKVISLNIDNSGDVRYGGNQIPFDHHSFDAVVSLDTLEHIPRSQREQFILESIRVARKGVIIAAPYGSPAHCQSERELCEYLEQAGKPNRWLAEHMEHGLPTPEEVMAYQLLLETGWNTQIIYAGDHVWQGNNLRLAIRLSRWGVPTRLANIVSFILGLHIWHLDRFTTQPDSQTNRFYLVGIR